MVQFNTVDIKYHKRGIHFTPNRESRPDGANNYWKLGFDSYRDRTIKDMIQYLSDRGYECRQNISRADVVDAIGRFQRGLLSYEGRGIDELQTFCRARGLPTKATTASRLARVLENSDNLATFPRFFELPAEIRTIIYELHFDEFDTLKDRFFQPPLTLASKQLRSETLPLFYECATFGLSATSIRHGGRLVCEPLRYIKVDFSSSTYMHAACFARIKKFDLHWRDFSAEGDVEVAIRFTATSELVNPDSTGLTLDDALKMGLESKFKTIENARKMLKSGKQPLTLNISGGLFKSSRLKLTRLGSHQNVGALMLELRRLTDELSLT